MARYLTLDGEAATEDDPNRGVWYGPCGCWTDDWDLLGKTAEGIPTCPAHAAVGFQAEAGPFIQHGVDCYGGGEAGERKFYSYKIPSNEHG